MICDSLKLRPPEEDLATSRNTGNLKLLVVLLSPMICIYIYIYTNRPVTRVLTHYQNGAVLVATDDTKSNYYRKKTAVVFKTNRLIHGTVMTHYKNGAFLINF